MIMPPFCQNPHSPSGVLCNDVRGCRYPLLENRGNARDDARGNRQEQSIATMPAMSSHVPRAKRYIRNGFT
jgi:hypothetical protein